MKRDEPKRLGYLREWERLISRVSTSFIRLPESVLGPAIDDALERLGSFAGADRCYVFEYDAKQDLMSNTHEWCAAGVEPQIENLQNVPASSWPSWMERLHRFEVVDIPRVRDLPASAAAERQALESQGIRSVVAVPMAERDTLLGFVGFDAVSRERAWNVDEVRLLRLTADIVANTLLRMRSDEELKKAREELVHAKKMEALGRFVGGTAHDFNNLLTVILGNCDLAETQSSGDLPARLGEIRKAAAEASALTRSLLAFARRQPADPQVLDANELIRRTESFLDRLVGERITVTCELDPEAGHVVADAGHLQNVLLNLAANARDAMPGGGKVLLRTRRVADAEQLLIEFADTGHGMDPQTLERAFDPFFTTKDVGAGTGLGLASVHGIVHQSQGTIAVESQPGRGTTFRIRLPSVSPRAAATTAPSPNAPALGSTRGGTLLVVEDDASVRRVVSSSLEAAGYAVWDTGSAERALAMLEADARQFDLVLTDLVMPGLGGAELIRRAGALGCELPFVVMTGYSEDSDALASLPRQEVRLLTKPFHPRELVELVGSLLR